MASTLEWQEGVLHAFVEGHAVVENYKSGELNHVPIKPEHLKFKVNMDAWMEAQRDFQRQAQAQAVVAAVPSPLVRR